MEFRFNYKEPPETGNNYRKDYIDGVDKLIERKYAEGKKKRDELIRQELDNDTRDIPIPTEIRDFYKMYRPAPLTEKGRNVHLVGDCAKVGNLRSVIWQAWDECMYL